MQYVQVLISIIHNIIYYLNISRQKFKIAHVSAVTARLTTSDSNYQNCLGMSFPFCVIAGNWNDIVNNTDLIINTLTNCMDYETRKFNVAFTIALQ